MKRLKGMVKSIAENHQYCIIDADNGRKHYAPLSKLPYRFRINDRVQFESVQDSKGYKALSIELINGIWIKYNDAINYRYVTQVPERIDRIMNRNNSTFFFVKNGEHYFIYNRGKQSEMWLKGTANDCISTQLFQLVTKSNIPTNILEDLLCNEMIYPKCKIGSVILPMGLFDLKYLPLEEFKKYTYPDVNYLQLDNVVICKKEYTYSLIE